MSSNNMTVELHVLVEIYFHPMTVAAQIIARQVYQHHVLGILLRVVAQEFGSLRRHRGCEAPALR